MCAMATTGRATHGGSSAPEPQPGRILAVDYGRRRIGLALSDELRITARPLATISRTNRRADMSRLREACRVNGVTHIIVGHPLQMTGEAGEMADEAARFASRLEKETQIGVELVDERLTSWEAERTATSRKSARHKRKPIDDVAAAVLLRGYLDENRGRKQSAEKE
jgi:putative holliday junction resolvase